MKNETRPETTGSKQAATQFRPGESGNPAGRPKGSRNKLGEEFIQALYADFNAHGKAVIEKVRDEKPDQYLKVITSILPKEIAAEVTHQYVARMPAPVADIDDWMAKYGPKGITQ